VPIRRLPVALFVLTSACQRPPDTYAPPDQRPPAPALDPPGMMLAMDDPEAVRQIVRDVYEPLDSPWRWTGQEPAFRVRLTSTANLKLSADFTLWDEAFRQTGPLDLEFSVNGRPLDEIHYLSPGPKLFEKSVPSDWLSTSQDTIVSIHVSKMYVSPEDSKQFGIILTRVGFVQ
jgi:hypothetical protein